MVVGWEQIHYVHGRLRHTKATKNDAATEIETDKIETLKVTPPVVFTLFPL